PVNYDADETLRALVDVVPFGVSEAPPARTRPAIKGVVPGIGPDDRVLLWGGGIYNWFDPLTLLHAVDALRRRRPDVRLFFLGLKHPNPDIPEMRMAVAARQLSDRLGLTGTYAFFNEGWVDYDDRQNYLLDADIGVSTHLDHVETAFSFRTRVLDHFWASLPTVATAGDAMADLIESKQLGLTVPAGDADALEAALARLLEDDDLRAAMSVGAGAMGAELTWPKVLAPLVEFCRAPHRAPDLLEPSVAAALRSDLAEVKERWRGIAYDLRTAAGHLREGGPARAARMAAGRVRRVAVTWRDRGPA
ncbi:MAG: glycosyltransferase, partial [Actinomycetota bacterium]|nr:glycosyltransferase [Actinomycetota bacterium]